MPLSSQVTDTQNPALTACSTHLGKHTDLQGVKGVDSDNFYHVTDHPSSGHPTPDQADQFHATHFWVNGTRWNGELQLNNGIKPHFMTLLSRESLELGWDGCSEPDTERSHKVS